MTRTWVPEAKQRRPAVHLRPQLEIVVVGTPCGHSSRISKQSNGLLTFLMLILASSEMPQGPANAQNSDYASYIQITLVVYLLTAFMRHDSLDRQSLIIITGYRNRIVVINQFAVKSLLPMDSLFRKGTSRGTKFYTFGHSFESRFNLTNIEFRLPLPSSLTIPTSTWIVHPSGYYP